MKLSVLLIILTSIISLRSVQIGRYYFEIGEIKKDINLKIQLEDNTPSKFSKCQTLISKKNLYYINLPISESSFLFVEFEFKPMFICEKILENGEKIIINESYEFTLTYDKFKNIIENQEFKLFFSNKKEDSNKVEFSIFLNIEIEKSEEKNEEEDKFQNEFNFDEFFYKLSKKVEKQKKEFILDPKNHDTAFEVDILQYFLEGILLDNNKRITENEI